MSMFGLAEMARAGRDSGVLNGSQQKRGPGKLCQSLIAIRERGRKGTVNEQEGDFYIRFFSFH